MTHLRLSGLLLAPLALSACGEPAPSNDSVEALEAAADQSAPAAAEVLENAAEQLEGQDVALPPSAPGSPVQEAMERAGNAQAEASTPTTAPPSLQAKPREEGDPRPPPKVTPEG